METATTTRVDNGVNVEALLGAPDHDRHRLSDGFGEIGPRQTDAAIPRRRIALERPVLERAAAAGCNVLIVTLDTKAQGPRERDMRNGFTVPPRVAWRNLFDLTRRLHWLRDVALGPRVTFANLAGSLVGSSDIISIARFAAEQYDVSVDWSHMDWYRSRWSGRLVFKGILTPQDARLAIEHGADAVRIEIPVAEITRARVSASIAGRDDPLAVDGVEIGRELTAVQHGRLLHLFGENDEGCCDFFHYEFRALAYLTPHADANLDGNVDAADYVVWRKSLGQRGLGLAADGNFNNRVDAADFEVWRGHFGQMSEPSATGPTSANASLPEPTAQAVFVMGMMLIIARQGTRVLDRPKLPLAV